VSDQSELYWLPAVSDQSELYWLPAVSDQSALYWLPAVSDQIECFNIIIHLYILRSILLLVQRHYTIRNGKVPNTSTVHKGTVKSNHYKVQYLLFV